MKTIWWYRWLVAGAFAAPLAMHAQGPQPIIKEIATIPGVDVDYAVRMPNGHVMVYGAGDSIVAYDLTTKRLSVITRGWDYDLAISPRGDRLAYTRASEDNKSDFVWTIAVDPATGLASGPAQRVTAAESDAPSFSPDGKLIACSLGRGDKSSDPSHAQGLAVVAVTGGAERVLARYPKNIRETSWSSDGKSIYVWTGGRQDTVRVIERVPVAGAKSERLMSDLHFPQFEESIDGIFALYRPDEGAKARGAMAYVTAGGERGTFTTLPNMGISQFFIAARALWTTTSQPFTLHVMRLSDGSTRAPLAAGVQGGAPRWSPDGKRLAVHAGGDQPTEIVIMNADGSGQRHFPIPGLGGGDMKWSPDGNHIAFISEMRTKLSVLDVSTGAIRLVKSGEPDDLSRQWRSDGQALLVARNTSRKPGAPAHLLVNEVGLDGTERLLRDISAEFPGAGRLEIVNDKIALVGFRPGSPNTVLLVPLPTGAPRELSLPAVGSDEQVSPGGVTPDHRWFVEVVLKADHAVALRVLSIANAAARIVRLPFEGVGGRINITPDGKSAIIVGHLAGDPHLRFYLVPLNGGTLRIIGPAPDGMTGPGTWLSPDGATLSLVTRAAPTTHVFDVDLGPVLQAAVKH